MGTKHEDLVAPFIHAVPAKIFADIAARDADSAFQVIANINKLVRVDSPLSFFILAAIGPAVWLEFSSTLTDSFLELIDTPSSYSGQALKVPRVNAGETGLEFFADAGGDVVGPASATDNALARFDLATGKLIQNSLAILDDAAILSGLTQLDVGNIRLVGNSIFSLTGNLIFDSSTSVVNFSLNRLINVVDPTGAQDAATKNYVDSQIVLFDTFLELTDTPSSFGSGNQLINVNSIGTALEFNVATLNFAGELAGLTKLDVDDLTLDGSSILSNSGNLGFNSATSIIDVFTNKIINLVDPTVNQDAATKKYVDDQNVGQVIGPSSSTDNAIVTFDLTTGKLIQEADLTLTGQTIRPISTDALDFILESKTSSTSSILCFKDSLTRRMEVGNKSTTAFETTLVTSQIIQNNASTALHIATRGNADSDMILYTSPGPSGLLERMRLTGAGDVNIPGHVGIGRVASVANLLSVRDTGSSVDAFITVGDQFERILLGQRVSAFPANDSRCEVVTDSAGNLTLKAKSNSAATINFFTGTPNAIQRMSIGADGTLDVKVNKIVNVVDPTADQDAATKKYVDDQILTQDTFLELTDTPSSYSGVPNQVVAVNNGTSALKFTPLTVFDTGQVLVDSTSTIPLIVRMNATSGNPSLIQIEDAIIRGHFGYFGSTGTPSGQTQGQIGWSLNGGCVYASRGNFAGGGHRFLTPNAALDTLISRMVIGDDPGHIGMGREPNPTDLLCVRDPANSVDTFVGIGDQIVRLRLGQRLGAVPTNTNAAEIVTDGAGNLSIKARSSSADSILLYTGSTTSVLRMVIKGAGDINIWNAFTAGTGQLTIGTGTPVPGAGLTIENSAALMCGQLTGATGKWQIKTVAGLVQMGSVQPTPFGILCNNIVRTRWDQTDGRIRNLFGQASKKTNIADADYTILATDYRIATTSITAARVYTIPSAEIAKGSATEAREWKFKDQSGNVSVANSITIATEGAETIDGAATLVLTTAFHDFSLYADGSNVFVEAA